MWGNFPSSFKFRTRAPYYLTGSTTSVLDDNIVLRRTRKQTLNDSYEWWNWILEGRRCQLYHCDLGPWWDLCSYNPFLQMCLGIMIHLGHTPGRSWSRAMPCRNGRIRLSMDGQMWDVPSSDQQCSIPRGVRCGIDRWNHMNKLRLRLEASRRGVQTSPLHENYLPVSTWLLLWEIDRNRDLPVLTSRWSAEQPTCVFQMYTLQDSSAEIHALIPRHLVQRCQRATICSCAVGVPSTLTNSSSIRCVFTPAA